MFSKIKHWWTSGRTYPNADWLSEANEEVSHSPDLIDLEARPVQLLFLPCELQSGHLKGELAAAGGRRLYAAFTLQCFSLLRNREDNSAIFLPEKKFRVKGELWEMSSGHYSVLDKYKQNGVRCLRNHVDVLVPYTRIIRTDEVTEVRSTMHKLTAWVYEDKPEYWADKLDGGYQYPSVTVYRPNNPFLNSFQFYHPNELQK